MEAAILSPSGSFGGFENRKVMWIKFCGRFYDDLGWRQMKLTRSNYNSLLMN